jgi:hypothetical protein
MKWSDTVYRKKKEKMYWAWGRMSMACEDDHLVCNCMKAAATTCDEAYNKKVTS